MRCYYRPVCLLLSALCLTASTRSWASEPSAVVEGQDEKSDKKDEDRPWLGIRIDAGVPDGPSAGLVLRPLSWLRFSGAASAQLAGYGFRGGFELVPFDGWISPTLSVELGRFENGDVDGIVTDFVRDFQDLPQGKLNYTYANAHLGLELGSRSLSFFMRGGVSLINAEVEVSQVGNNMDLASPVVSRILTPSAKVGLTAYLF